MIRETLELSNALNKRNKQDLNKAKFEKMGKAIHAFLNKKLFIRTMSLDVWPIIRTF